MSALVALTDGGVAQIAGGSGCVAVAVLTICCVAATVAAPIPKERREAIAIVWEWGVVVAILLAVGGGLVADGLGHALGWIAEVRDESCASRPPHRPGTRM